VNERFDSWIRSTLEPRGGDVSSPTVDIRRLVGQAKRRRVRTHLRVALSTSAVVLVGAVFLAVTPDKIGSSSGRSEIYRVLPDGSLDMRDPISGLGPIARKPGDIEAWDRVAERTAAGEEEVVGANFLRFRGRTNFSINYRQFDPVEGKIRDYTRSSHSPPDNTTREDSRTLLPIMQNGAFEAVLEGGKGIPQPNERHQVDGKWYRFKVWAFDFPGTGLVAYGTGVPEDQ
jgi:hypothetical protein